MAGVKGMPPKGAIAVPVEMNPDGTKVPPHARRDTYLEPSPVTADAGLQVGKLPGSIPLEHLRALGHPESPIKAIRAKCKDCCGGNEAEVRKCTAIGCALWPFRMGVNPFYGKGDESKP
jgi:hypothetical protein